MCHARGVQEQPFVVYLNGVAASGKSTLAAGVQARWPEPVLHVGLDMVTETMPSRFLGAGPEADLGARWVTDGDGRLIRVDPGPFGVRLLRGLPRLAAALARAGNHVIVDDVLLYRWRVPDVAEAMAGTHAYFVEVRCPKAVALERGRDRPGRGSSVDMIEATYEETYAGTVYDLRVDTSVGGPEAAAAAVTDLLERRPEPRAFDAIRAAATD